MKLQVGERTFKVGPLRWSCKPRFEGDDLWAKKRTIVDASGREVGAAYWSCKYDRERPQWTATACKLAWTVPGFVSCPAATRGGFDVGPFDSLDECLKAWGRSAEYIYEHEQPRELSPEDEAVLRCLHERTSVNAASGAMYPQWVPEAAVNVVSRVSSVRLREYGMVERRAPRRKGCSRDAGASLRLTETGLARAIQIAGCEDGGR